MQMPMWSQDEAVPDATEWLLTANVTGTGQMGVQSDGVTGEGLSNGLCTAPKCRV